MNWTRLKRRLWLFVFGQVSIVTGAALIVVEPVIGIGIVLLGVVFHTKLLMSIMFRRGEDAEVTPA